MHLYMLIFLLYSIYTQGGCNRRTQCSLEELPHVRGQGQKPGGTHAQGEAAKRSYPTSQVRGSGQECQAATAQEWLRGATPHPRSGVVAGRSYSTSKARDNGREELPMSEARDSGREELPTSEARGGGQEYLPHTQGQGWLWGEATPPPRSSGCWGAGGPRGAIPRSRSEGAAVRRYPLSKVRSSGCALLEQL